MDDEVLDIFYLQTAGAAKKTLHNPKNPTFEEHGSNRNTDEAWKISELMHLWERNLLFEGHKNMFNDSKVPPAPHITDCKALETIYEQLDKRNLFGQRPKWPLWKDNLRWHSSWKENEDTEDGEALLENNERLIMGPYPPWVFTLRLYVNSINFCNITTFNNTILTLMYFLIDSRS